MKLVRYRAHDPFKALESLHDEINRLFNLSLGSAASAEESSLAPAMDIYEDEKNIYVEADLPGLDRKDVKVSVKDNSLVVTGKKEEKKEEEDKGYIRRERYSGSFYRSFSLPVTVNAESIKAEYKSGVLKVILPKKKAEKEKEITIE